MSYITLPNGSMIDAEQLSADFSGMSWDTHGDILTLRLKSGSELRFSGSSAKAVMDAIKDVDTPFEPNEEIE